MAASVTKLETQPAAPPDGSKPIKLRWFKPLATIGVRIDQLVQKGASVSDGVSTTGYVESITLHPAGNCVVELLVGYHPEVRDREKSTFERRYLVMYGGHGMTDWEGE